MKRFTTHPKISFGKYVRCTGIYVRVYAPVEACLSDLRDGENLFLSRIESPHDRLHQVVVLPLLVHHLQHITPIPRDRAIHRPTDEAREHIGQAGDDESQ